MAMIGLKMPPETERYLASIEVPGEPQDFGHAHVTLCYLGDDVPLEQVLKAAEACFKVAETITPIKCMIQRTKCFPPSDKGIVPIVCPIECPVESNGLQELKKVVDAALDEMGVDYSKKWPEYNPHTTLAYATETCPEILFDPIEWTAFELFVWGGDDRDSRIVITVPFHFKSNGRIASRVASRWLSHI